MSLEARHIEDEIYLKVLSEPIFVVFFQIDKSRTTKVQIHPELALILNVSVSKAALKSNRTRRVTCCLFMFVIMSL